MKLVELKEERLEELRELFCECFFDDWYYAQMFPDQETRRQKMGAAFEGTLRFCLKNGFCFGVEDASRLIAFILCFDFHRCRERCPEEFAAVFSGAARTGGERETDLCARIGALGDSILYEMSLGVKLAYRRRGIASGLVDYVLERFRDSMVVSDISNRGSVSIYKTRNFSVEELEKGYFLVAHDPETRNDTFSLSDSVRVIVPDPAVLARYGIAFREQGAPVTLFNAAVRQSGAFSCFEAAEQQHAAGTPVTMDYEAYLQYQRVVNLAQCEERLCGDACWYEASSPFPCEPLLNGRLEEMLPTRASEWAIVPDMYVSIPVECRDGAERILREGKKLRPDRNAELLLKNLEFRTGYEAGVPSAHEESDDLSQFKARIIRQYLGKVSVWISEEAAFNAAVPAERIGAPALVDVFISLDRQSSCAVLTLASLSLPFLLSHFMDNVIRNSLMISDGCAEQNFFDYFLERYGIVKRGTPKMYAVIPREKTCLKQSQVASLLACETIYPDGEDFGELIDAELSAVLAQEKGMGQYDRGNVYAYKNAVLQFDPSLRVPIGQRIAEEAITLFYIELILFEEAAIHIADRRIKALMSAETVAEPVAFLRETGEIYEDYSRTIDFWSIQVNYPTSQKSIDMLRKAFRVDEELAFLQRDQQQLQTLFDTKSNFVDRVNSRRVNSALAILSVLAVFSAWMDGHDFIATWNDLLSSGTIHLLQRAFFLLILITAVYTVARLVDTKNTLAGSGRAGRKKKKKRVEKER